MNASETMLQFVLIGIIVGREPGRTLNPVRGLVVLLSGKRSKGKGRYVNVHTEYNVFSVPCVSLCTCWLACGSNTDQYQPGLLHNMYQIRIVHCRQHRRDRSSSDSRSRSRSHSPVASARDKKSGGERQKEKEEQKVG